MRLTRKLTLALACAILVVLGVDGFIRVQHKAGLFEVGLRRDAQLLGRTVAGAAARIWRTAGEAQARDLVENANERQSEASVRWVWLDAPAGSPRGPDVPREAIGPLGAGTARSIRWRAQDASAESLYTYYSMAIPLTGRAIEIRESLEPERAYVRQTILSGVVTTGVLVALCAAVAIIIGAVFVGGPVRRLVDQARRVGRGDLSTRLTVRQRDEIGELAAEMNTMCRSPVGDARAPRDRDRGPPGRARAAAPRRPPHHRRQAGRRPGPRDRHAAQRDHRARPAHRRRVPARRAGARERAHRRAAGRAGGDDHPPAARLRAPALAAADPPRPGRPGARDRGAAELAGPQARRGLRHRGAARAGLGRASIRRRCSRR